MCRYKRWDVKHKDRLFLEGNNGGDLLAIEQIHGEEGMIRIKSGHCCVYDIDAIVPVEFLTTLISEALRGKTPQELMQEIWPTDYGQNLARRIKEG